jgi:hypothetical protein
MEVVVGEVWCGTGGMGGGGGGWHVVLEETRCNELTHAVEGKSVLGGAGGWWLRFLVIGGWGLGAGGLRFLVIGGWGLSVLSIHGSQGCTQRSFPSGLHGYPL